MVVCLGSAAAAAEVSEVCFFLGFAIRALCDTEERLLGCVRTLFVLMKYYLMSLNYKKLSHSSVFMLTTINYQRGFRFLL